MRTCPKVEQSLGLMLAFTCCLAFSALAQLPSWIPRVKSNGQPLDPGVYPHPGVYITGVSALAFNRDGTLLAVSTRNGAIAVLDARSGDSLAAWRGPAQSLAFAFDGSLVSATPGGGIKFWEATTGKLQRTLSTTATVVAATPDGKLLAGVDGGSVRVWEAATGRKLRSCKVGRDPSPYLAFSSDGRLLAVVESKGKGGDQIKLSDVESGKALRALVGSPGQIRGLAFSPDGRLVATAENIWEVASGRKVQALLDHESYSGVAISPDGRWLVSGGLDKTPVVREMATGKEVHALVGHKSWDQAVKVAFDPNGKSVATGGRDNTVRLWDLESGRELRTLKLPRIWDVSRADITSCNTKPGANPSETSMMRCTVSATLRNTSGRRGWLPSAYYGVFLYQEPGKMYELKDLSWEGKHESINTDAPYRFQYVALDSGEEGEFTMSFDLPEDAVRRQLSLVVLDAPPVAVGAQ